MIKHSSPAIGKEELEAVKKVLGCGHIAQGEKVKEFEGEFKNYIGTKYAAACNSGTAALHLALRALGISKAEQVIMPSYVCTAVLNALCLAGASFRLVDINISDYNISFQVVKKAISRRTKAIIVPHMFGQTARVEPFLSLGVPIVEDCALAAGGTYKNRKLGSFGLVSIFSFYATKMLTTAEGGMVLTNDRKIADKIRDLRDYDEKKDYLPRFNYKMTDLSASLGIAQLGKLEYFISRRREIASLYNKSFSSLPVFLPRNRLRGRQVYSRYVMRLKRGKKNLLLSRLNKKGIECKSPVFRPLHRYLGLDDADFPCSSLAQDTALSIPIYPALSKQEINKIITVLGKELERL